MIYLEHKDGIGTLYILDWEFECLVGDVEPGEYYIEAMDDTSWGNDDFIFKAGHSMKDTKNGIVVGDEVVAYRDDYFIRSSFAVLEQLNEILAGRQQWKIRIG